MADYLIVIDMQKDYVGQGKCHDNPNLVRAVNDKIASYPKDRVIYVINRFFWVWSHQEKKLIAPLSKVSPLIFEKRWASCFTNQKLLKFLREKQARSLEFLGVDGNACVNKSVLSAVKLGFQTEVDVSAIGAQNQKRFQKTKQKWQKQGVSIRG